MHRPKSPVPAEEMERRGGRNTNSICQKLREIYELTDNDEAKIKLRVATAMAKAMAKNLKQYKAIQQG